MGEEVTSLALNFLNDGGSLEEINDTFIVLIPKIKNTDKMVDFRPISLCNVLCKIIAKTIANKLKCILPWIIDKSQNGLVPDRLITDNVILAIEIFHWLQGGRSSGENFVAIKLDISKAYDRVEWGLVLVNGFPAVNFSPERGAEAR